jgi:ribosomal protein L11 methyltransferase
MSWMELSLDTTNEAVDWVCTLLATTNYTSDIRVAKYIEPSQDVVESSWAFTICFYLPNDAYASIRRSEIINLLSPLERTGLATALQTTVVEEKSARADIHSPEVRIGQRFVVLSPDADYHEAADEITLRLKTSLAFGSGLHPATVLSMRLLEKHIIPAINVLDLGSGSGILSVAIAKLGGQVLALDNDPIAVKSTTDTVERNGVEQQVTVMEGSLGHGSDLGHWMGGDSLNNVPTIEPTASFDLIVANILARVHIALVPDFRRSLRQGGLLIAAGFTNDYEEAVTASFLDEGFEVVDCERLNEWVAIVFQNKIPDF